MYEGGRLTENRWVKSVEKVASEVRTTWDPDEIRLARSRAICGPEMEGALEVAAAAADCTTFKCPSPATTKDQSKTISHGRVTGFL